MAVKSKDDDIRAEFFHDVFCSVSDLLVRRTGEFYSRIVLLARISIAEDLDVGFSENVGGPGKEVESAGYRQRAPFGGCVNQTERIERSSPPQ